MSDESEPPQRPSTKPAPKAKAAVRRAGKSHRPGAESDTAGGAAARPYPVVGIGASAGGLAALKRLFELMPVHAGMAYVVVLHLDPGHESHMAELLAKVTSMPVVTAADGMPALPDRIHVIPPNCTLTIRHGVLHISAAMPRAHRHPIDEFFKSLGRDQQERAIAVVLTGTGSDGSRGIREVKAEGGLLVAQDPDRSEYDGMPRSAIATGSVDCINALEEIPQAIVEYVEHARLATDGRAAALSDQDLKAVLALLKGRGDFDFSWYKRTTVQRRVRRRMGLSRKPRAAAYLEHLRTDASEAALLVNDLLIGVTAFFREPEAWSCLADTVLAPIVEEGNSAAPIRVWVPACSSGEEAYTLAMLLFEQLERSGSQRRIQMFATDVDEQALEVARAALYPARALAGVDPARLQRFFEAEGDFYRVSKRLRECIVFARQNLITDSPFSRLDLVSCRNLLIYLESLQQERVLSIFHFVIKDQGYLFLGNSETVGKQRSLFASLSKKWRIYRRIGASRRPPKDLPAARGATIADRRPPVPFMGSRRTNAAELGRSMLLEHCVPAAVLVDRNAEVLYFHGDTDRYLAHPQGEPTTNLLDLARPGLRGRLRAAMHRANLSRERTELSDARVARAGETVAIRVSVIPWAGNTDNPEFTELSLVTLEELPPPPSQAEVDYASDEGAALAQLEDELKRTREELQSTIEELETANEELKVSHEEAMSINEELQSTNEELETSKEELQSLNEELTTINGQLEEKVGELQATTDDLDNLLVSSNIATLFLDRQCHIKRFTPAITKLMRLIESDVGRHITDIASRIQNADLLDDAAKVLADLHAVEREVNTDDAWYLRRVQPYRSRTHRIEGVVITFTDISEAKRRSAEQAHLAAVVSSSDDAIVTKDQDGTVLSWNRAAERMYGYRAAEMVGKSIDIIVPEDRKAEFRDMTGTIRRGKAIRRLETVRLTKDGRRIDVELSISPVFGDDGKPVFFSAIARNVSEIKNAQREVQRLNRALQQRVQELQTLIDVAPVGITIATDSHCRSISTNPAGADLLRAQPGDNVSLSAEHGPHRPYVVCRNGVPLAVDDLPMQRAARDGVPARHEELQLQFDDGRKVEILMNVEPLLDEEQRPRGAVGVFMNIAERKEAEAQLRQQAQQLMDADRRKDTFLAVLGHELRNPLAPIRNVVDLLENQPNPDPQTLRKVMEMVGRQVNQLTRLVDDLLDVARITHDDLQLQRERIDLRALCERVVADCKPMFDRHAQDFRFLPGPLPSTLCADPVRIEQIVSNLLHNASNYTPEGGSVTLEVTAEAEQAVIRVRDDGVGIPMADQQAIFDPFSHTASRLAHRGKTGLGLGLALAQRLVQMHEGTISVYSEGHNHGTEFTVRLPLIAQADQAHHTAAGKPIPVDPKRILLVEDNTDVSDALTILLKALGHEVRAVHAGNEAVGCAAEFRPQVAFIDIGLPDIDGYEVARRLRAQTQTQRPLLIALSGYGRTHSGDQAEPFDDYLLKPLSFDRIGEILSRAS